MATDSLTPEEITEIEKAVRVAIANLPAPVIVPHNDGFYIDFPEAEEE